MVLPQHERDKITAFLLYLNEHTFFDDIHRLEKWVKLALRSEFQIVLAWEKDVKRGGCSFDTFFSQTLKELKSKKSKDYNLYNAVLEEPTEEMLSILDCQNGAQVEQYLRQSM